MTSTRANARFTELVAKYHAERFRRQPTLATVQGVHLHDDCLEDFTLDAVRSEVASLRDFQQALRALESETLRAELAADRAWLLAVTDGRLQELEVFRPLETDPDRYSASITDAAFTLINRQFAPAETRARSLLARLHAMPAALEEARINLTAPSRVRCDIALDQLPGNIAFFRDTLPAAFEDLTDPHLKASLDEACIQVALALARFSDFVRAELLPVATEGLAIGEVDYRRKLYADEMLGMPLDALRAIGQADLAANQAAMAEAARAIDPTASVEGLLARLGSTHVPPDRLLETTQAMLPELLSFIEQRDLLTVPPGPPLRVVETPTFMRATVIAAMDTPGPFELEGTEAYYYMTPPNPAWPQDEQDAYMRQWNRPLIANLSAHEAYPGHYVQFLLAKDYPTLTRRLLWSPTNVEGWAHYCEHLMWEEGFHASDPWFRVAQLHDALLRNARVLVGLEMHTAGMTVAEAVTFFEREAHLSAPVAKAEAWRGATDPTYGYYTLGKLMLLKLREDVKQSRGDTFSLKAFHDEFLRLGPIPIPLARMAMLGAVGEPLA